MAHKENLDYLRQLKQKFYGFRRGQSGIVYIVHNSKIE